MQISSVSQSSAPAPNANRVKLHRCIQDYQDMLKPCLTQGSVQLFKLCDKSQKTQQNSQVNPYNPKYLNTHQRIARAVINDFVLMTLIHNWFKQLPKTQNIPWAITQVHAFLESNGPNSEFLQGRLKELSTDAKANQLLLKMGNTNSLSKKLNPFIKSHTPLTALQAARNLHEADVVKHNISTRQIIKIDSQIPNELSGLRHTLKKFQDVWYETYPSYQVSNPHDCKAIGKMHDSFVGNGLATKHENPDIFKLVLGIGNSKTNCKVRLAVSITDTKLWANKKISLDEFKKEKENYSNLPKLPHSVQKKLNLPTGFGISTSKKNLLDSRLACNNSIGNIILPLIKTPDNKRKAELNLTQYSHTNDRVQYERELLAIAKNLIELTQILDQQDLIHPDLKTSNTHNVIADCADLISIKKFKSSMKHQVFFCRVTHAFKPAYFIKDPTKSAENASIFNRYALGIMLIHLVASRTPFQSGIAQELSLPLDSSNRPVRGFFPHEIQSRPKSINQLGNPTSDMEYTISVYGRALSCEDSSVIKNVNQDELVTRLQQLQMSHNE